MYYPYPCPPGCHDFLAFRDFVAVVAAAVFFAFVAFGLPDFAAFFGAAVFAVFFCADCSRFSALVGGMSADFFPAVLTVFLSAAFAALVAMAFAAFFAGFLSFPFSASHLPLCASNSKSILRSSISTFATWISTASIRAKRVPLRSPFRVKVSAL